MTLLPWTLSPRVPESASVHGECPAMRPNRLALLLLLSAFAPLATADAPPRSLEEEIALRDREFFDSFNTCDQPGKLEEHARFLDPKLEFYHDLGGVTWTAEAYLEGVRNN